jgi:hypothetical protein
MNARTPRDLDAALRELAAALDVPPPPDYAARVLPLLDGAPARQIIRLHPRRVSRLLLAAAAVLLSALATTVAVPASRHALASWLGFTGIEIRSAPSSVPPLSVPPSPPSPAELGAGERTTLHRAEISAKGRLELPSHLPRPTVVFEYRQDGATVVTLAYRHVAGLEPTPDTGFALLITEVFDAGEPVLVKLLHAGAHVSQVNVHGAVGVYVKGPQEIMNADTTRTDHGMQVVHEVPPRASANTLIWAVGPLTVRLEGAFSRSVAVKLAESIR